MQVAVIGASRASDAEAAAARTIGNALATAGVVVVTGGRGGIMAAATTGAHEAGGTTVALLPGDDPTEAAVTPTVTIPTGLGEARNALVARSGDAVVAVGGAWGTLSELALAVQRGTPVVGLHTWALADDLPGEDPILRASSPADAVRQVVDLLGLDPA